MVETHRSLAECAWHDYQLQLEAGIAREVARNVLPLSLYTSFYVTINLMMVMGLAPVVGIPLPFMSHGGSSMMTNMICIGTLMMVERYGKRVRSPGLA